MTKNKSVKNTSNSKSEGSSFTLTPEIFSKLNIKDEKTNGSNFDKSLLALVMMIKNEEKRITVSFDSVKEYTDTFVILDTGSTDSTIEICRDYCKKNNIRLFLKETPFVNFMESRNVLLDYCDEVLYKENKVKDKRFMLLLDCNDELKNHSELANFISSYKGSATGFYLKQQWWTGNNMDSYFNIRMVKAHEGWRYRGVVHEYIICEKLKDFQAVPGKDTERCENIILFQDRTVDDDKSFKRFSRDKEMLHAEYLKNPKDPRTLFYLAQTCGCLGNLHEAYRYYLLRTNFIGFIEEVYHAYFRLGEMSRQLGHPWEESLGWYLKAFSHSQRAEPLVRIAEYYEEYNYKGEKKPDYMLSYMYASMACKLVYPLNQILFVDRRCYFYKRWHLLGKVAFYVQQYKDGKEACIKAIQAENQEIDTTNLVWYLRKEAEINKVKMMGSPPFITLTQIQLDKENILPAEEVKQTEVKMSKEDALRKAYNILLPSKK